VVAAFGVNEGEVPVGVFGELPAGFVDEGVVLLAQQDHVVEAGGSAVGVADQVVGFEEPCSSTPREPASAIAYDQCSTLFGGGESARAGCGDRPAMVLDHY